MFGQSEVKVRGRGLENGVDVRVDVVDEVVPGVVVDGEEAVGRRDATVPELMTWMAHDDDGDGGWAVAARRWAD